MPVALCHITKIAEEIDHISGIPMWHCGPSSRGSTSPSCLWRPFHTLSRLNSQSSCASMRYSWEALDHFVVERQKEAVYAYTWWGGLSRRFCSKFSESSTRLQGQQCSCSTSQQPGELSENILQNHSEQVAAPPGMRLLRKLLYSGRWMRTIFLCVGCRRWDISLVLTRTYSEDEKWHSFIYNFKTK